MTHGPYITEFEEALARQGFTLNRRALADLVAAIDFARLAEASPEQRSMLYAAISEGIPRAVTKRSLSFEGRQVLAGGDSVMILGAMQQAAAQKTLPSGVRDLWCLIFIGGCP